MNGSPSIRAKYASLTAVDPLDAIATIADGSGTGFARMLALPGLPAPTTIERTKSQVSAP